MKTICIPQERNDGETAPQDRVCELLTCFSYVYDLLDRDDNNREERARQVVYRRQDNIQEVWQHINTGDTELCIVSECEGVNKLKHTNMLLRREWALINLELDETQRIVGATIFTIENSVPAKQSRIHVTHELVDMFMAAALEMVHKGHIRH